MKTLIIYDDSGYVLSITGGNQNQREPMGVPFLWEEIPEGKRIKLGEGPSVDVSKTPPVLILEDIPPSEIDQLKQTVADLTEIVLAGGM